MNFFFLAIFLAFIWMLIHIDFTLLNFIAGLFIGAVAISISQPFGIKLAILNKSMRLFNLLLIAKLFCRVCGWYGIF